MLLDYLAEINRLAGAGPSLPSWGKLGSSNFDTSDLAAEYYDEILFEGKTFSDILASKGSRLNINATEIAVGAQFTFGPRSTNCALSGYHGH